MTSNYQFPEILKYLRNEENWSQSYLAAKLDISTGTYSSYERGISDPSLSTLIKLSDIFKVSIDYLAQGKEFALPLTPEETNNQYFNRMTLRLENRIEGQTRILNCIGRKLENDLTSIVKNYSDKFIDIFSRSSGVLLLDDEVWSIEQCSKRTMAAYPSADEFLRYDEQKQEYVQSDYFHNLVSTLRQHPENQYIEIYAKNVNLNNVELYKKLIKQQCGKVVLNRFEMRMCEQFIIAPFIIFMVDPSLLRTKHPSVFKLIEKSLVDNVYLAMIVPPREDVFSASFLADKKHCRYIIEHFNELLKKSNII